MLTIVLAMLLFAMPAYAEENEPFGQASLEAPPEIIEPKIILNVSNFDKPDLTYVPAPFIPDADAPDLTYIPVPCACTESIQGETDE